MYPVSDELMSLFESGARQTVTITGAKDSSGNDITLTDADIVQGGLVVDRYSSTGGNMLEMGTAVAAEMAVNLFNGNGEHEDSALLGNELHVSIGIADRPDLGTIPLGYFTPQTVQRQRSSIIYVAYDRMVKFNKAVPWKTVDGVTTVDDTETGITSPMALSAMVQAVCTYCGVPLGSDFTRKSIFWRETDYYPNKGYSCTIPYQDGLTFRTVIQWAAFLMGTCAYIDYDGTLKFEWYNVSNYAKDLNDSSYSYEPVDSYIIPDSKRFSSQTTYRSQDNEDEPEYYFSSGISYADKNGVVTVYAIDPAYTHNHLYNHLLPCAYCPLLADADASILYNVVNLRMGITRIWDNPGTGVSTDPYYIAELEFGYVPFEATILPAPWLFPMDAVAISDTYYGRPSTVTHMTFKLNDSTSLRSVGQEITNYGAYTNPQTENFVNAKVTDYFTPVLYIDKSLPAAGFGMSPQNANVLDSAYTLRINNRDNGNYVYAKGDGTQTHPIVYLTAARTDTNRVLSFGISGNGNDRGIYDASTASASGLHDWVMKLDSNNLLTLMGDLPLRQITTVCPTGLSNIISFAIANRSTDDTRRAFVFKVENGASGSVSDSLFGTSALTVFANFSSANYGWIMACSDYRYCPWAMAVVSGGTTYGWYTPFGTVKTQSFTAMGKTWEFRKVGKVVHVNAGGDATSATGSAYNAIGTLDADMRPAYAVKLRCENRADMSFLDISTAGVVRAYSAVTISSASNFAVCGSYECVASWTNV